jgi:Biopolymer transport proteins
MEFDIVEKLLGFTLLGAEWVLWLLLILSVASIAVMVERYLFFSKTQVDIERLTDDLINLLKEGNDEIIKERLDRSKSFETQVLIAGIQFRSEGSKAMEESMIGRIKSEKSQLDRGLTFLGTLGNNAPFIGLFGTVIGIILAFKDLAENPAGGPSVVMSGISEALVATAVGLFVAIPAVIAFNFFNRVVKKRIANAEALMHLLLTTATHKRS